MAQDGASKSIKAAIPSHPKPKTVDGGLKPKSIKAAIPSHPKLKRVEVVENGKVYQSRDSQPSKAPASCHPSTPASLSKPRFPAIQSRLAPTCPPGSKSIKAAIPSHPKHRRDAGAGRRKSIKAAIPSHPKRSAHARPNRDRSLSKPRFPAIQSVVRIA